MSGHDRKRPAVGLRIVRRLLRGLGVGIARGMRWRVGGRIVPRWRSWRLGSDEELILLLRGDGGLMRRRGWMQDGFGRGRLGDGIAVLVGLDVGAALVVVVRLVVIADVAVLRHGVNRVVGVAELVASRAPARSEAVPTSASASCDGMGVAQSRYRGAGVGGPICCTAWPSRCFERLARSWSVSLGPMTARGGEKRLRNGPCGVATREMED